jgi:ketosteroid isomerase-like protein
MTERTTEEIVKRLSDLEDIRELARRYAHYVWQKDSQGAIALFTDDAVMDTGDRPPIVGRDALLESYRGMFDSNSFRPFVHNHVIEFDSNGVDASGTCYLDLRAEIDGATMAGHGFYADRYRRVGTGWKFTYRLLTMVELSET